MSDIERIRVKVVSSTPGADSSTYNLFDSTVTFGAGKLAQLGISRVEVTLANSGSGTLKAYRSTNGGTNWDQVGGNTSWVASTATDINGPYDFLVDGHADVKVDWVNGGSAQTTWRPDVHLIKGFHGAGT